jgi:hypothetical protein
MTAPSGTEGMPPDFTSQLLDIASGNAVYWGCTSTRKGWSTDKPSARVVTVGSSVSMVRVSTFPWDPVLYETRMGISESFVMYNVYVVFGAAIEWVFKCTFLRWSGEGGWFGLGITSSATDIAAWKYMT